MLLWILFAAHYLVLQGGGELLGFHVAAMQVCARSWKGSGWEPPPPPKDLWHIGFACRLKSQRLHATCTDVSFLTLYGGQFTSPTQLIKLNYPVILSN